MTRVCLVGGEDANLRYELLSRETARRALATYDPTEPYENALAVETVSLGAAVALLNDLDWHLARFARGAWVLEPSVSEEEWISRALATAIRDGEREPGDTGRHLTVYGFADGRLVDPMYLMRTDGEIPAYDLREVEETVVVRVTEAEFQG